MFKKCSNEKLYPKSNKNKMFLIVLYYKNHYVYNWIMNSTRSKTMDTWRRFSSLQRGKLLLDGTLNLDISHVTYCVSDSRGYCKSGIKWPTSRGSPTRVIIRWDLTESDVSSANEKETSLHIRNTSSLCASRSFSSFRLSKKVRT